MSVWTLDYAYDDDDDGDGDGDGDGDDDADADDDDDVSCLTPNHKPWTLNSKPHVNSTSLIVLFHAQNMSDNVVQLVFGACANLGVCVNYVTIHWDHNWTNLNFWESVRFGKVTPIFSLQTISNTYFCTRRSALRRHVVHPLCSQCQSTSCGWTQCDRWTARGYSAVCGGAGRRVDGRWVDGFEPWGWQPDSCQVCSCFCWRWSRG